MISFADTFALIAWLNPRDIDHNRVVAFLDGFTGRLVTTEWVLIELADAALRADGAFDGIGFSPGRSHGPAI